MRHRRQRGMSLVVAIFLVVVIASADELTLHEGMLATIGKASKGKCLWQMLEAVKESPAQSASSA